MAPFDEQVPGGPTQHHFEPYTENGGSILGLLY
jgi:hypothetical protein